MKQLSAMGKVRSDRNTLRHCVYSTIAWGTTTDMLKHYNKEGKSGMIGNVSMGDALESLNVRVKEWWEHE